MPLWAPFRGPGKEELAATVHRQRGLTMLLASAEGAGPKFERECRDTLQNEVLFSPPAKGFLFASWFISGLGSDNPNTKPRWTLRVAACGIHPPQRCLPGRSKRGSSRRRGARLGMWRK